MNKYIKGEKTKSICYRVIAIMVIVAMQFAFVSCSNDYSNEEGGDDLAFETLKINKLDSYENEEFINSINEFASKTLQVIFSDEELKNENINYSPISLYFAMSLLCTGTEGESNKEILELLCVDGKDNSYLSKESEKLFRNLYSTKSKEELLIANSLWMQNDIKFNDSYKSDAEKYFYSSLFNIDFSKQQDVDKIGKWVSDNTKNLLKPKFDANSDQLLSIVNTIYYKSSWIDEFDKNNNINDRFYIDKSNTIDCEFMNKFFSEHSYIKGNNYISAGLQMKNGVMEFILPDEGVSVYDLINDSEKMTNLLKTIVNEENSEIANINFMIPKFKIKSDIELVKYIDLLGCKKIFDSSGSNKDFKLITDESIFVSNIEQGTYIDVNEQGAEAAAYTVIENESTACPIERELIDFRLDRPFIYVLKAKNDTILFIGICNNPNEE